MKVCLAVALPLLVACSDSSGPQRARTPAVASAPAAAGPEAADGAAAEVRYAIVAAPRPNSSRHTPDEARSAWKSLLPRIPRVSPATPAVARWQKTTPGYHLHLGADGGIYIDGTPADLPRLRRRTQDALNMVDSVTISVLLTFERDPADDGGFAAVFAEIFAPAIQIYVVQVATADASP